MHYYPHHIGDFIKDTANLDDHQLATYLRMIWAYYTEETPMHDDCESIAFAMRSDEKTVRLLLKHYFFLEDDCWHHARCDREIEVFHGKSEKARNSANARWKNANAKRAHSERNANEPVFDANQEPRTKNQEEAKSNASSAEDSEGFDAFWTLYPKKTAKKDALKAWKKIRSRDCSRIMRGLFDHLNCDQWSRDGGSYIPNPATWLNGERWNDEVKPYDQQQKSNRPLSAIDQVRAGISGRERERQGGQPEFSQQDFIEGEFYPAG